jgi:pimeloyl-ACP methyl ester carboxylesterase
MARFSATAAPAKPPVESTPVTSRRGHFWVGAGDRGPMYVYWESPATVTKPYPIVLVHGGGGQGLDYLTTPDGRAGWSTLLVEQGWVVYVVDRPGHGRSPYIPDLLGPMGPALPVQVLTSIFVPPADGPAAMPFAPLHTQWPGDRNDPTDPALLQFLASGGPFAADAADRQALERQRLSELLDRVGPAFVISNSLGGPSGFLIADARPDLVVGLVQLEPIGPAFATNFGPDTLQWGVAAVPVAYDPPAATPAELSGTGDGRMLTNISKVPIAVVSGEASVFRFTNPPLVEFLQRCGCDAVHIDLPEHGVHGNSHGAMFEKNNADVLAVVTTWMTNQLR